ncbi:DHA2 family efflux MFS transporter permease subunit [Marmoricola sp. RAF53]|uniref:DHA2 family efflux MFS transporter permease subunit n=1 Tax=Marmoricola sp. RAF53 TaxID=3233059 RepID=UPI003F9A3968
MSQPDLSTPRARNLALALLAMTQFVVVIDASIVNVALPSIGEALDFSQNDLSWVVNAYTLAFGGFLLLGGRLADYYGRRRVFMFGMALFALASLAGGLAQSETWLITARAAQGLGAAIASPAALSIITTTFSEGQERNRALGIWGAVAGAGGAAGVLLGGILTEWAGWEWVLFVNVPIGAFIVWQAPKRLAESTADEEKDRTLDLPGAITVSAGLALLVYAMVDAINVGWSSAETVWRLAAAAALLVAFVVIELRTKKPLVPFSIFRKRTLRGANAVGVLIGMSLFSMFFLITLYLQQVLGFSALEAGVSYLPLAIAIILSAGGASALVTRIGFKNVLIMGMVLVAVALAWFSQINPDGTFLVDVLGPSVLAGVGLGFAFVPVTIAAVTGIEPHEAGLASGLINTTQQVGGALGLAILASIANASCRGALGTALLLRYCRVVTDEPWGMFEAIYAGAESGAATPPWDYGAARPQLVEWADARNLAGHGREALVVGCGYGADAEFLAERGYRTTAFDFSPTAVAAARRKHPDTPVTYAVADVLDLPEEWQGAFDLVVESLTVQSMPPAQHRVAAQNIAALVAPGGTLLVLAIAREDGSEVSGPPWPLTRAEVEVFAGGELVLRRLERIENGVWWRAEVERSSNRPAPE